MNRHKSFIKGALTGALIMLFAVGVCTKVPELSGLLLQKDSVTAKQERAEKKTEAKFKKIEKMIDQYYLYSDDVKQEDLEDAVYKTQKEKFRAVCDAIEEAHAKHQPVLVGTRRLPCRFRT